METSHCTSRTLSVPRCGRQYARTDSLARIQTLRIQLGSLLQLPPAQLQAEAEAEAPLLEWDSLLVAVGQGFAALFALYEVTSLAHHGFS